MGSFMRVFFEHLHATDVARMDTMEVNVGRVREFASIAIRCAISRPIVPFSFQALGRKLHL